MWGQGSGGANVSLRASRFCVRQASLESVVDLNDKTALIQAVLLFLVLFEVIGMHYAHRYGMKIRGSYEEGRGNKGQFFFVSIYPQGVYNDIRLGS